MKVFIENEAGSFVKHEYNEKTLEFKGTAIVSSAFPWPYGFVLHTTGEDGDNVDCFVLTGKQLLTGEIVDCDPIGLMEKIEDGDVDHKVLAQLEGESVIIDRKIEEALVKFSTHVFDHIPGKTTEIGRFLDRQAAIDYIQSKADPSSEEHPGVLPEKKT